MVSHLHGDSGRLGGNREDVSRPGSIWSFWISHTDANTEASRAEAARLGLTKMFDEYGGATGMIVVVDGRTKEVTSAIKGSRDVREYHAAIDAALAGGNQALDPIIFV